jgi:hypothetical protein
VVTQYDNIFVVGILIQGGCAPDVARIILDCFTLFLTGDNRQQLDPGNYPSPRQRVEFRGPNAPDQTTFLYTWKHFLDPSVGTTPRFFHLMQVFSTGDDGPIVTLDAVKDQIVIRDYARSCVTTKCPSIPLSSFVGQVTFHTMTLTCGPVGNLIYTVKDGNGNTLISYTVSGAMGYGGT